MSQISLAASSSQLTLFFLVFNANTLVDNVWQIVSKCVFVLVGLLAAAAQIVAEIFLRKGHDKGGV